MQTDILNMQTNEPQHEKTYLRQCSLISQYCVHEETLHPWLSEMHPVKLLNLHWAKIYFLQGFSSKFETGVRGH